MSKFLRPSKQALKNAQHFSLIQAFITVLQEAGFTAAKIVALTAHWQPPARRPTVCTTS